MEAWAPNRYLQRIRRVCATMGKSRFPESFLRLGESGDTRAQAKHVLGGREVNKVTISSIHSAVYEVLWRQAERIK